MRKVRIRRRTVLAAAVALNPTNLNWLTAADATPGIRIPDLDGELLLDAETRAAAADDYGHIVHRTPLAVLRPASTRDVQKMIHFANRHRLKVTTRGQGHSTYGQAQTTGVVIDSSTMATIHQVAEGYAVVDGQYR